MNDHSSLHPILAQENPWVNNSNDIWLASTVQLLRNMDKFNFPGKLDSTREKQIISLVKREFLQNSLLQKPKLYYAEETTPLEKEFLMEHFLTLQSFQQTHIGEGFILDETGEFLLSINIQNHFNFQLTETKGDLEGAWNKLVKIESALGKTVNFAYSNRYGYLTANPLQCGTGLVVSLFLQPSALIHTKKIDSVLKKIQDESIYVSGLQGNPTAFIGDVVAVHNQYTLGLTEENIISSLSTFANKLIAEEKIERSHLKEEDSPQLKDQVSRAYGIIVHSYQTETLEALDAISLLKLGLELGWITGMSISELNRLFFNCRRAHLVRRFDEDLSNEKLLHKRAEYVHENLKNLKLII